MAAIIRTTIILFKLGFACNAIAKIVFLSLMSASVK